MSDYETFDMQMSVYPATWEKAQRNVAYELERIEVPARDVQPGWIIEDGGYRMHVEYVAAHEGADTVLIVGKQVDNGEKWFRSHGHPISRSLFYNRNVERVLQADTGCEPSIETMQQAVVRVLRQVANDLESRTDGSEINRTIFINGERIGNARFGYI